jgi:hypothetical protein
LGWREVVLLLREDVSNLLLAAAAAGEADERLQVQVALVHLSPSWWSGRQSMMASCLRVLEELEERVEAVG